MDFSILMEYGWVLLVLVVLEGLLATDNALVLAIMVKHLPEERKKALILWISGSLYIPFMVHFLSSVPYRCMAGSGNWSGISYLHVRLITSSSTSSNINRVMKSRRNKKTKETKWFLDDCV